MIFNLKLINNLLKNQLETTIIIDSKIAVKDALKTIDAINEDTYYSDLFNTLSSVKKAFNDTNKHLSKIALASAFRTRLDDFNNCKELKALNSLILRSVVKSHKVIKLIANIEEGTKTDIITVGVKGENAVFNELTGDVIKEEVKEVLEVAKTSKIRTLILSIVSYDAIKNNEQGEITTHLEFRKIIEKKDVGKNLDLKKFDLCLKELSVTFDDKNDKINEAIQVLVSNFYIIKNNEVETLRNNEIEMIEKIKTFNNDFVNQILR